MNIDIGGIAVKLLLNKKPLEDAKKDAEQSLRDLERKNQEIADRISTVAAKSAAALVAAFAAAGYAVKRSLDHMAEIERLSQALGMTTEELSRLEYVAERAGVPMEKLRASVVTLSKGLTDTAATGTGDAALALEALGIKATDVAGRMKSARDVMGEVADRFASLKDGVNKTRLAVALFGEAGAELIPALNRGSEGMERLEAEADRLGVTLDKQTTEQAKKLKATVSELVAVGEGYITQLTGRMIPGLQAVADEFLAVAKGTKSAGDMMGGFFSRIADQWDEAIERAAVMRDLAGKGIVLSDENVNAELQRLRDLRDGMRGYLAEVDDAGAKRRGFTFPTVAPFATTTSVEPGAEAINLDAFKRAKEERTRLLEEMQKEEEARAQKAIDTANAEADAIAEAARAGSEARIEAMIAEGASLEESLEGPLETMERMRQKYAELAEAGVISADVQAAANTRAAAGMASAYIGAAGQISGALSQLFSENKGFALANAIVNTAEGITKALAVYGPTPIGFAAAAAAAASGAAQIAAIRSAQKGGSGQAVTSSVPRGQGGGQSRDSGASQAGPAQTLYVQGISPNSLFTGDALRDFAERLIEFQKDGGRVVLGSA